MRPAREELAEIARDADGFLAQQWDPSDLPPHVLGHIGYAIVPWKQRRGYATAGGGKPSLRYRIEPKHGSKP